MRREDSEWWSAGFTKQWWDGCSAEERQRFLDELDEDEVERFAKDWRVWGRDKQLAPQNMPDGSDWRTWLLVCGRGFGKGLCVETKIPTPIGWVRLGDFKVGDTLFDENGSPCKITDVFDYIPDVAYRMGFSDGTSIDACDQHLWVTWLHRDRKQYARYGRVTDFPSDWPSYRQPLLDAHGNIKGHVGPEARTTQAIVDALTHGKRGDTNHCIPVCGPLAYPSKPLPIDPWLFGYWLGNGSTKCGSPIACHHDDVDHVMARFSEAGFEIGSLYATGRDFSVKGLADVLRCLGVLGDKHVPRLFLQADIDQRRALLAGLLDSDGHCTKESGHIEFCSMLRELADAVVELARSLGEKPVLGTGRATLNGVDHGEKYRVSWRPSFNPFFLPRKSAAVRSNGSQALRNRHRMIVSAERIEPKPMRCLKVDSRHSMFLCGEGMIPTHNTRTAVEFINDEVQLGRATRIAIVGQGEDDIRTVMIEGQALALDTPIFTPLGWSRFGDLATGDEVFSRSGKPTKITAVSHTWTDRPCYAVKVVGAEPIIADERHLWVVDDDDEKIISTVHLFEGCDTIPQAVHPESGDPIASRMIESVERVPSVATRCITVADPSGTFLAGRDLVLTHNSGFLETAPSWNRPKYSPSVGGGQLVWPNGAVGFMYSAEDPEALRGPQFDLAWFDEPMAVPAAKRQKTVMNLRMGLRLGRNPRIVYTTTPKPHQWLRELIAQASDPKKRLIVTRGTTYENAENLADSFVEGLLEDYEGTRVGRQEIHGELLGLEEGALWDADMLNRQRMLCPETEDGEWPTQLLQAFCNDCDKVVVGVDPNIKTNGTAHAAGIVVVARKDKKCFVIADRSVKGGPSKWGAGAVNAAIDFGASEIIAEANQGGEMVRMVIRQAMEGRECNAHVRLVHATKGKQRRAEPVAQRYDRGEVFHLGPCGTAEKSGSLYKLEAQMTNIHDGDDPTGEDFDRADGLVWGLTRLARKASVSSHGFRGGFQELGSDGQNQSADSLWDRAGRLADPPY